MTDGTACVVPSVLTFERMDMHQFARRSAAATMAFAGAALLFTAGCSSDDTDSNMPDAGSAMSEASGAMTSGTEGSGGMPSGSAAASETKIMTQSGQEITVSGNILAKYTEMGGAQGTLGEPTAEAIEGPNGGSCQEFTGGAICWSEQTQAHVVWGDIRQAWEENGGVNGNLGYPTSDEQDTEMGKESTFTGGSITWNSGDRQTTVTPK